MELLELFDGVGLHVEAVPFEPIGLALSMLELETWQQTRWQHNALTLVVCDIHEAGDCVLRLTLDQNNQGRRGKGRKKRRTLTLGFAAGLGPSWLLPSDW